MATFVEDMASELRRAAKDGDRDALVRLAPIAADGLEIKEGQLRVVRLLASNLAALIAEMPLDDSMPGVARMRASARDVQTVLDKPPETRQ